MKKLLLPLLLFLAVFSGCGDDKDEEENEIISKVSATKELLQGKWEMTNLKVERYTSSGQLYDSKDSYMQDTKYDFNQTTVKIFINGELNESPLYTLSEITNKLFLTIQSSTKWEYEITSITKGNLILKSAQPRTAQGYNSYTVITFDREE
ncbi:hypothetical protein [Rufibacter latericius]|uniref:Lipocalin-like domain-containing protein n=1 Tax=Rufibacter latericius TaxID=2487040 RepID=A0A3M9MP50_9BACT|nr:hypothetical protein [Rufibacter latericius]RNI26623.1 hypothetical protein EFB08_11435 [Rufibacter latericius]